MKKKVIALLLLLTIMIVVVGTFAFSKSQTAMTGAQGIIQAEISNAIGSVVTMGQVEITSLNTITIHDFTIYDKQAEVLATSEKVTVTYSLWNILRGQAVVNAISDIAVEKPSFWLTQESGGRWNVQDLLNQNNTTKTSFSSKVTLIGGTAMLKIPDAMWTLEDINGSIDFAHQPSIDLQLQAVHKGATVKAKGSIDSQGLSTVTVSASELLLADYQVLVPKGPVVLVGGSVKNLEVTVARKQGDIEWAGDASLAGVDVDLDGNSIRQIQGNMSFTNKKVYVFATAKVLDQPIDVRGSVRLDTTDPLLNLTVASTAFDAGAIPNNNIATGIVAFKADVTGLTTNPIINGDVTLVSGQVAGYDIYNAQANGQLMNNQLTIKNASADMLGGHVAVTGTCQLENNSYQLHVKAEQIDLASVPDIIPDSSGRGDVDVTVNGTGSSLAAADVQGTVAIGQGQISGVPFNSLGVGLSSHNGIIAIDYANISLYQGLVTAKGILDHQNVNLTVYGQGIDLQQIDKQVSGQADFAGQITGSLSEPEFIGYYTAINGQAVYQPFTQLKGNIHVNRHQLVMNDMELIDGVTTHSVQGTLNFDGQRDMNITVKTHRARAENLIKLLAPGEKLTGNVDNEMVLTGSLDNINAQGHILLTDGSFRGQLVAKAEGSYQREQGTTTISEFRINSLNTRIRLSGSISPSNELNFDIVAQHINMERINLQLPYPVTGVAQFTGKLTGTISAPEFNGQLAADKLTFNNQDITGVMGQVIVRKDAIEIPSINFMQGKGKFGFSGGYGIDTSEIYGYLDIEDAQLQPILAALAVPDKGINGRLNGHMSFNGTLSNPNVWLTGNLREGKIKQYPVESIAIDVAFENHVLKINDLSALQGLGILVARGTADLNGSVAMEVSGRDIDAGVVAALLNTTVEPIGKMSFTAQISGQSKDPHAAISLDIVNGGVNGSTFDSLYGLLSIDKKMIHVNQVLLKKGPYQASAYGTVPVAALSPTGRKQANIEDQMDLKIRLDNANLSILPFLTKEVESAEGPTQGQIQVAGTLEQPIITGNLTVNNGVVKLKALKSPIQKVGVDINFEGDTINIKKFDGQMGKGSYSLTGTTKLHGLTLSDYDLSLLLNKPEITSKYFTGAIDGNLKFTDKGSKPTLSGKLLFENDTINIPAIPDMAASDLDIGLAVDMQVGKKVRFYNPNLYDILAEGRVNFSGSTLDPDFSGHIVAVRGSVNYLRTEFKVNEASVEFKSYASFQPIVTLSAQTRIQQITVNLNVNGPVNAMQFNLTADPTMSQQEIISLLTLRSAYIDKQNNGTSGGIGRDEISSILSAGLQMQFMGQIEGSFRNALGLDEFRLVKDTTSQIVKKSYSDHDESTAVSQEVYNIEMSKSLTDKLLLSYTMGIDHNKNDLALTYTVNRHINLTASIDEQKNTWFGFESRYRF